MAKRLPLYPNLPVAAIETVDSIPTDPACSRCDLSAGCKRPCVKPAGSRGGLLVVTDVASKADDATGHPFSSPAARAFRRWVEKKWDGPVMFDTAVRCSPVKGVAGVAETHVKHCRPYLARTLQLAKPERILCLGRWASAAVLGRKITDLTLREHWGWVVDPLTPVFPNSSLAESTRNPWQADHFYKNVEWGLTVPIADLKAKRKWAASARIVVTTKDARWAEQECLDRSSKFTTYDVESAGLTMEPGIPRNHLHRRWDILCVGLVPSHTDTPWIWPKAALRNPAVLAPLKRILENPAIKLVGQNEKFDRNASRWLGIEPQGFIFDTRLVSKILHTEVQAKLETLQELVGMGGGKGDMSSALANVTRIARRAPTRKQRDDDLGGLDLPGTKQWCAEQGGELFRESWGLVLALRAAIGTSIKKEAFAYGLVDQMLLYRYNGIDVLSTKEIALLLMQRLRDDPDSASLTAVWEQLARPSVEVLGRMEWDGISVDDTAVRDLRQWSFQETQKAERAFHKKFPDVNLDSPKQLSELLFTTLRLTPLKVSGKTGRPSVDAESLGKLKGKHSVIQLISDYTFAAKIKGTYADPMLIHRRGDGKIHCTFNSDGTRTGRLSSSAPNLQNMPRVAGSIAGKLVRNCFAAKPGYVLVHVDLGQSELRVSCVVSGDTKMAAIFASGEDFHLKTAQMVSRAVWGIAPEDVDIKTHRSQAKSIVFGTLFGKKAATFSREFGISKMEAEKWIREIIGGYPDLSRWIKDAVIAVRRTGLCYTEFGPDRKRFRRRQLYDIRSTDTASTSRATNGAVNTPIQGEANDLCLDAMNRTAEYIASRNLDARLVLSIHDALVVEAHPDCTDELLKVVPEIMTSMKLLVPLIADTEVGLRLGSLYGVLNRGGDFYVKIPDPEKEGESVIRPWREALEVG